MTGPENHSKVPEPVPPLPLPEFAYADLDKQERIGTGGDANVYRATLEHDGYTYSVAIKEPRFEGTIQKRTIEKFQNEAETWAGLNDHDNIVSVYAWGAQPVPWLALEHMDGDTLETRIGDADISEALWLSGRIAEGIRYGHRHGIAHLDIKPTNILLRETGPDTWNYPKVSDWGLAKLLLEHSNSVEGISPTFAAPEQFDAEEFGSPDDITDIYQLGTVVYALVTGEPPFSGSSTAVMRSVLDDEPKPPSEVNSDLPTEVDEVVLKALAKRKADRYEGILPFRKALDELFAEVANTGISSGTSNQSSTGREESIAPAATRSDSDRGTDTEQTNSAPAGASERSSRDTQSADNSGPITRRRALGLLGLGLGGAGGLWAMGGSNDGGASSGDATIGVNSPTQSPQPTATQSETSELDPASTGTAQPATTSVESTVDGTTWDYSESFEDYTYGRILASIDGWKITNSISGYEDAFKIEDAYGKMPGKKALSTVPDSGNFQADARYVNMNSWLYPDKGFRFRAILSTEGGGTLPQAGVFAEDATVGVEIDTSSYGDPKGLLFNGFERGDYFGSIEFDTYEVRVVALPDQTLNASVRPITSENWISTSMQTNYSGLIQGVYVNTNNGGQFGSLRLRQIDNSESE